jgi:hypothetical protein
MGEGTNGSLLITGGGKVLCGVGGKLNGFVASESTNVLPTSFVS